MAVEAHRLSREGIRGLSACEMRPADRPLHHHLLGAYGKRRLKQSRLVIARGFKALEQLELLFRPRVFALYGKHRVEIDEVGNAVKALNARDAVAWDEIHARDDFGKLGHLRRPPQGVCQKGRNYRIAFEKAELKTRRGKKQGILAQARCRVYGRGMRHAFEAGGLYEEFATRAFVLQAGNHMREVACHVHGAIGKGKRAIYPAK